MQITGTSFRRSANISNLEIFLRRKLYGKYSYRPLEASRLFMTWKSFTETWKVQISSFSKITLLNLVIWTCLKWQRKASSTHRREHPITPVQRSGRTSPTIANLIFGLLAVSFMKCVHWFPLSGQMIWMGFSKEFSKDPIPKFPLATVWIWGI